MKRIMICALALLLVLSLAACGEDKTKDVNLDELYASFGEYLPEMMTLEGDMLLNYLGIDAGDCTKVIAAVCANGLQADEVWLIQAKDQDALNRLLALAQSRQSAKEDETESYLPDQYAIVKEGKLLTEGLYLAYLVSPSAQQMQTAFENAVK